MPTAPMASIGRLNSSAPEYHCSPVAAMTLVAAHRSHLASLTATMLGWLAIRIRVSGLIGMPARDGMS